MPAKPRHRQPIVSAAVTLFRQQGYTGTRLDDITDISGAPKGSLYHYFPDGKTSIAAAAVDEAGRRVAETMRALAAQVPTAGDLLIAHARLLSSWMQMSGYRDGCPITTVLLELAPRERRVTEAGRKAYAARTEVLTQKLIDTGTPPLQAARLAVLCVATLQGALIQARVERRGTAIEVAASELARLLELAANQGQQA